MNGNVRAMMPLLTQTLHNRRMRCRANVGMKWIIQSHTELKFDTDFEVALDMISRREKEDCHKRLWNYEKYFKITILSHPTLTQIYDNYLATAFGYHPICCFRDTLSGL
jgi:hypothetical protein